MDFVHTARLSLLFLQQSIIIGTAYLNQPKMSININLQQIVVESTNYVKFRFIAANTHEIAWYIINMA